jgi:hypothetical protein
MRRILSILLLLVLGLGPAGAADGLASGLRSGWTGKVDESRVPACCRRDGKHHCSMSAEQFADLSGETTVAARESCPCMPQALASTAPQLSALAKNTPAAIGGLPAQFHASRAVTSVAHSGDSRDWPRRGPPAAQTL